DPVVITHNATLTLAEGSAATITTALLQTSDDDDGSPKIIYTITAGPSHVAIEVNGLPATTFTQADIDADMVSYIHDGSENFSDSFNFTVSDDGAAGGSSPTTTISRTDPVVITHNATLTLAEGSAATITTALLQTSDDDD